MGPVSYTNLDVYKRQAEYLRGQGVETEVVNKLHEGRPNLGDMITNKQIDLIINTPCLLYTSRCV